MGQLFFSAATGGFLDTDIVGADLPDDAVQITPDHHRELMAAHSAGALIQANAKGQPVAVLRPELRPEDAPVAERSRMKISRFQARAALHAAGLLEAAEAAVEKAGPFVKIAWADTIEWNRDSPTIAAIGSALNLTPEKIDDLFRQAATITA